ncbi:DNA polymerase III subunit alpha [Patescibacteria group bacterium]|nr:DNA polymerase III subunit alpha [Patescibacteria group bacterium]
MKYTPLHVHSHYSLLDGLSKLEDLVQKAKDEGMTAIALTDHGVMHGAIEFYQKCRAAGIKPIIGVEAYIVEDRKKKVASEEERFHLILLAKNYEGYKNLIKLTSIAHLEGFYYKPRIDWEILRQYSGGIVCTSACLQGEVSRAILKGWNDEKIDEVIARYIEVFGRENFYLEVQHHPNLPDQKKVNDKIFEMGKRLEIPIVATNDTHYVNSEDAEAHDILICLQTKKTINEPNRMSYLGEDFSLHTCAQMSDIFRGNPEVLENTNKIAEQCDLEIPLGQIQLPYFEVPAGLTDFEYLRNLCYENIQPRFNFDFKKENLSETEKVVIERLEYELEIIKNTGYASYFLIVQDFINWAKNNGVVVGPGRGSAAGSLVAYLVSITNLDPLKYDLLFERFLNPARVSMPDIDTDFADVRRDEVLKYVEQKYGKDHVAQIITFGTMAARAAVRDVGRVLEMPYSFCDQISKLLPGNMKLHDAVTRVAEVKELYDKNPDAKRIIDFAKKLEGVARHASTHACGVVISQKPLDEYCPCQFSRDKEDAIVTQYSLHPIEDLGLLKMDFLGLKNLTIIETAVNIIEKIYGNKIEIDDITLEDEKAYKLFQDGLTTGVFQFESSGMKRYLKQLAPSNIEDLIAMVALYRPGPMDLIPDYIERKHGRQKVEYVHPKLESSLAKTFGIAIYQEQVMQIARDLAGFSLGEADVLRKAMGKKNAELLAEQKEKFIKGCISQGIDAEVSKNIFAFIEPFAGYGFNRSHAACYAFIAYQTSFLKANYPAEFMAALLTADHDNMERVAIEIDECRKMGIEILPPSINESYTTFTVVADSVKSGTPRIRFGLNAIRNVGQNVVKSIIHERKQNGAYENLEDFLGRLTSKDLNKKSLEGLIKSGALDIFGERNQLMESMDKLILYVKEMEHSRNINQTSLFGSGSGAELSPPRILLREESPAKKSLLLSWEREFLGLYVSEHPFSLFEKKLAEVILPLIRLKEIFDEERIVRVGGIVRSMKKIMTKKGDPMLFVMLEDGITSVEILVFPRLYKEQESLWKEEKIVVIEGTVSLKDGEQKILCNKVWELEENNFDEAVRAIANSPFQENNRRKFWNKEKTAIEKKTKPGAVTINYPIGATKATADKIKMFFMTIPGNDQVFLKIQDKLIKTDFLINVNEDTARQLESILGRGAIGGKKDGE